MSIKALRLVSWVAGFIGMVSLNMGVLVGCATTPTPVKPTCLESTASPTSPEILERMPVLREFRNFEDPPNDFLLDHPFFEENFDAVGVLERTKIPSVLDLRAIRVGPEGNNVMFQIRFAQREDGGPTLRELLTQRRAQVGIYVDTDRNGVSDFLVTTTAEAERGLVVTHNLTERMADVTVRLGESELTLFVPKAIIGDRFDWIIFSGFTPIDDAYFRTNLDMVFFLPLVDVYYPQDIPSNVGFSTSYTGTGKQCHVTTTTFNTCPAQGNPTLVQVPNTSPPKQGVLLYDVRCNGRGYDFWCLSQSFFGKHVYDAGQQGWIARCPFTCGLNQEGRWDSDSDGLVDKIYHTITDQDCGSYHDGDGDGLLDVMAHTYLYSSNQVTSCNLNRNYSTNVLVSKDCKPAQAPYTDPGMVPGHLP
ncbi:MAG: hypothetical protein V1908_00615 [Candidatus Peregrinibacteria bacterium]